MIDLIPFDYQTLRVVWWALLGLLLIGFAVMDGFDIGVAMLLPVVARTDAERRVLLNVVGPVWEGNQVWLITGGGAIFAAWPLLYAASFSTLYLAMMVLLLALILRPVGFKYRSKIKDARWRASWDTILCVGGVIMALVFGVAMGNLLLGMPFGVDPITMRPLHEGGIMSLLRLFAPFALLAGLVSITMCVMHGGIFLAWRTDGAVSVRARRWAMAAALATAVLFGAGGFWLPLLDGHVITQAVDVAAASNPTSKTVVLQLGAWMANFERWPWMWLGPVLGVGGALLACLLLLLRWVRIAFLASALSLAGIILSVGFALFPFLMPSSLQPDAGLTVWDASASHFSLWIMLLAAVVFMPLVIGYTGYVYRVMRGKVTENSVSEGHNAY